jgi:hypothetical protein
MAEVQHSQIRSKLLELVAPLIDTSDIPAKSTVDIEAHILSRSMAAAAIKMLGDADDAAVANAIVDGGKDNGLDAIYYDPTSKTLFLVQSKWSNSHASSIESGAVLKFLQGVQDLVSLKKGRFNDKIQKRWNIIEDALKKLTSVRLVVAYSGSGKIDPDIQDKIDDFESRRRLRVNYGRVLPMIGNRPVSTAGQARRLRFAAGFRDQRLASAASASSS